MENTLNIAASDYPIKSVTVFKSAKAEVVRVFSLALQAGRNKVEIRELPTCMDTQSVRVSGLVDARLFDVVCTIANNKPVRDAANETLHNLRAIKDTLESEKRVREQEAQLLHSYASTLNGEHVNPVQMATFLEAFVAQNQKNLEAVMVLNEGIIEITHKIHDLTEKAVSKKGSARGEVVVVIGADAPVTVDLRLTYIVSDVSWKPTYELRATTNQGKPSNIVTLEYRARLTQSTGENWTNTALTLSTISSDTTAKSIPKLSPVKLKPQTLQELHASSYAGANTMGARGSAMSAQQKLQMVMHIQQRQQQMQQMQSVPESSRQRTRPAQRDSSAVPTSSYITNNDDEFEDVTMPDSSIEPMTVVTETPIAISYSVHGKSTIPSDGVEHQVAIAVLPFEAGISYVAAPRIEPCVYLQCKVKNTSEYRLLPGPVSVILDDSYVSKTSINDINTGDTFDCTLGDDTSTKITYTRTLRTNKGTGGAFVEAVNTTTYNTRISVHNKHAYAIEDLIVRDVIPTAEDKRMKVILNKPAGLADVKDGGVAWLGDKGKDGGLSVAWEKLVDGKGGEREGRFEWRWKVGSGEKVLMEAEWEVKAPADVHWTEVFGQNPWK